MPTEDAIIRVRLDVQQAKAAQKEMDAGFQRSTEAAGGIGKALFGGLSGASLVLAGPLAAIGGATVAPAVQAFQGAMSSTAAQALGINAYAGRVGAASGARDTLISQLGPAAKYVDDAGLRSFYETLLLVNDAAAQGADRIRDIAAPEIAGRAFGPGIVRGLQRLVDFLPDSLFR